MRNKGAIVPRRIYEQVYELLRNRIVTGTYGVGDKLPSVAELRKEAGVSHVTAFKALNRLVREGFAKSVNGKARGRRGTFVALRNPEGEPLDMRRVMTLLLPKKEGSSTDQYWHLTLCGIQRYFSEQNILTVSYPANDERQIKQFLEGLRRGDARGVILSNFSEDHVVYDAVDSNVPIVLINREVDIPGVDCVLTDYERMIEESVKRFASRGFKKYFFFRLPKDYRHPDECAGIPAFWNIVKMANLFEEKARRAGGREVFYVHDLPKNEFFQWCRDFLSDPEACVFALTSSLLRTLSDIVEERPEWRRRRAGVIGVDDYVLSPVPLPFDRWRIDLTELGSTAAKTLEDMISGKKSGKIVRVKPVFVEMTE